VTDNKNVSDETVEETAVRLEPGVDHVDPVDTETATDAEATETHGKHEASDVTITEEDEAAVASFAKPKRDWSRIVAFVLLPALAFVLAIGAGVLRFMDSGVRDSDAARDKSMQAAKDSTVALLSYKPDTVEQQLTAARDRLIGQFRDQYTDLTNNVVIPGAKEKQISAVASVPAAASVSADPGEAVVLLFVNQTVTVGNGVPTDTASSVRITLDKVGERWLISKFEPV
jgi:Mce-associated membrane protein